MASQIAKVLDQQMSVSPADASTTALVARNIEDFADELEIPRRSFSSLLLRECAHHRSPVSPGWPVRVQSSDTRSILRR